MYFGGIPKMTTLKKLLQNMKSVMQTRSFRQILMLCLMLIGLLVVYFIYVRKYNVNKREGAAGGRPETEEEMNVKVDEYLERLNACTNLDPNSGEYTNRLNQQEELAKEIKAGFNQKIDTIERLKNKIIVLQGKINDNEEEKKGLKRDKNSIETRQIISDREKEDAKKELLEVKQNCDSDMRDIGQLSGEIKALLDEQTSPEEPSVSA
jgi:chromosome segregation ATPase